MADRTTQPAELCEIPLARIVVAEAFNPRGSVVEDDALGELAQTIAQRGLLQPLRVRTSDTGRPVAGEVVGAERLTCSKSVGVSPASSSAAGSWSTSSSACWM